MGGRGGGKGKGGGGGGGGATGAGGMNVNASTLDLSGNAITGAGAPGLSKTSSAAYRASNVTDPKLKAFYGKGNFVVSHRSSLGSLARLKASVKKAGYKIQGSMSTGPNGSRIVVFNIPKGGVG